MSTSIGLSAASEKGREFPALAKYPQCNSPQKRRFLLFTSQNNVPEVTAHWLSIEIELAADGLRTRRLYSVIFADRPQTAERPHDFNKVQFSSVLLLDAGFAKPLYPDQEKCFSYAVKSSRFQPLYSKVCGLALGHISTISRMSDPQEYSSSISDLSMLIRDWLILQFQ